MDKTIKHSTENSYFGTLYEQINVKRLRLRESRVQVDTCPHVSVSGTKCGSV